MSTATTQKKTVKPVECERIAKSAERGALNSQLLTGSALLKDMKAYHKKVTSTPDSARDFLTRLGVMTSDGKVKTLIRG